MEGKQAVKLESVQETLLLPLWGRAVETQQPNPGLIDRTAVSILSQIDYDFTTIARNINDLSRMAWIARSIFCDAAIQAFIAKYPRGTLVNIGCGLDTTFDRIDNGTITWFDMDLPDVIELRRQFIPETERRHFLSFSVFDPGWFERIVPRDHCLFLIAGVLYYFAAEDVKGLFRDWIAAFPGVEIIFDYTSPTGVKVANKKVIDDSGMDQSAYLKWGMKKGNEMKEWDERIQIIRDLPMFKDYKKGLDFKSRLGAMISDSLRIMSLAHIRLGEKNVR